jgi:hypothetical protein
MFRYLVSISLVVFLINANEAQTQTRTLCPAGTCSKSGTSTAKDISNCSAANCTTKCPPGQLIGKKAGGGHACIIRATNLAECVASNMQQLGYTQDRASEACHKMGF